MRVLWFSNVPMPVMAERAGKGNEGSGHWVAQLARYVTKSGEVDLGIATAYPGMRETHFREDGVDYFVIPQPKRFSIFGMRAIDIAKCCAVIERFKPDIIHIHGSERFFGMVKAEKKTNISTLISIQGLLGPFTMMRHYFGALSFSEIFRSIRLIELPFRHGLAWHYFDAKRAALREAKILAAVDGVLGRTDWDRAHAALKAPNARYFHVGEILRPSFSNKNWTVEECQRHTLIYTNAGHPCRGIENLLAAIALLRKEFPDIRLRLAGNVSTRNGYGRFLRRRISTLQLADRVDFLGYIDDETMARELLQTHVFVIPTYIDNSPNSLAEAMLVGLPCVASYVGGIPSMITDNETGLLYPVEEVPLLVENIKKIFIDDNLAIRLGRNATVVARHRHDHQVVIGQLLKAYAQLCKQSNPSNLIQ